MRLWCGRCGARVPVVGHREDPSCLVHGPLGHGSGRGAVEEVVARRRRDLHRNVGRRWTLEERRWVFEQKDVLSSAEMGARLGRSAHAIDQLLSKARRRKRRVARGQSVRNRTISEELNARVGRWYRERELAFAEDGAVPGSLPGLARRMGRTVEALRRALNRRDIRLREADGMMSPAEVARAYHLTERTVRRWICAGKLPAVRSGTWWRVDPAEAERVLGRAG